MSNSSERHNAAASSIIYHSADQTVVLVDVPRSLEESQVLPGQPVKRRIYSDSPPYEPFLAPEPKGCRAGQSFSPSPAVQIQDLMTAATVENALQHLQDNHAGPLLHPRISVLVHADAVSAERTLPVQDATPLCGSIEDLKEMFKATASTFQLIVLDPPWPNRSARRVTDGYNTVSKISDMHNLLTSIPIAAHLASSGLVAIWITNKASIPDFLTSPNGIFAAWGVELVAEWIWLKITAAGKPIFDVHSTWRKPWEKILIARRIGATTPAVTSKVIIAVPDIHSRKPSLRGLFNDVFGQETYPGLEVFARNLTAGWWSWGDQVLLYQGQQYWDICESQDGNL